MDKHKLIIDGKGRYLYARIHRDGGAEEVGNVYLDNSTHLWSAWRVKRRSFLTQLFSSESSFQERLFLTEEQAREWMKIELKLDDPEIPTIKEENNLAPNLPSDVPRGT